MSWRDAAGELHRAAPMAPQVQVAGATTVELDLRKAKPVRVNAPEPTETYRAAFKFQRTSVDSNWGLTGSLGTEYGPGEPNWWVLPTSEVSVGTLAFRSAHVLVPPSVTMKVTGNGDSFDLDARYATPDNSISGGTQNWRENGRNQVRVVRLTIPRLPTNGQKPIVYAGTGTAEELAKVDAKGALVLVRPTDICTTTCNFTALRERVAAAAAAGAVGVLVAAWDRAGHPGVIRAPELQLRERSGQLPAGRAVRSVADRDRTPGRGRHADPADRGRGDARRPGRTRR